MTHTRLWLAMVAPILLLVAPAVAAPQLEEFSYVQDFEAEDPVVFWAADSEYEVHFEGLSEE